MFALLCQVALASDGAYVVGPGEASLYAGFDAERITRLATSSGSYADDVIEVDQGLSKFTTKAIVSYGLAPRVELQLVVPWSYNHANRTDGGLCTALGEGCAVTKGFGVFEARTKLLLLDELDGAPLSLALGPEVRLGQLTWATRDRVTNLGEGTFDAGGMLGLGKSGSFAKGYWATSLTARARYRFPNTEVAGNAAPGWETEGYLELLLAPTGNWAIGPDVAWFFRPTGTDVETSDFSDPDWIAALRVEKVAAGGSVHLRGRGGVTWSAGVFHNVWAVNNPTDALLVTGGVQVSRLGAGREER